MLSCLALYVYTAARDIVVGDTPELMTVAVTLGVAHPSGYPLLTLLGHLFSLLPLGPVAFRVNLMAAVCGAGTVALVYVTAWRLSRSWPAAVVATVALALNPLFWSWSLVFEAFSLNNFLAATMIWLLVLWETRGRDAYLVAAAFTSGLALSNHLTIVLLGPATLFLLGRHRKRLLLNPRVVGWCVAALLLGLLPYAYIPWAAARRPLLSWGDVQSASDLMALFLRTDYGTGSLVANAEFGGGSPGARLWALGSSFFTVEGPLAFAGAFEAYRRERWYCWFTLLAMLVSGPAFVAYANMDLTKDTTLWVLQRFFLLSHVVAAPLMAFGVVRLVRLAGAAFGPTRSRLLSAAVYVGALTAAIAPGAAGYSAINQRDNHIAGSYARELLDTLEPNTILLATGDEHTTPAAFVQTVEGKRPDVTLVLTPLMRAAWYVRLLRARYPELKISPDKSALALLDIVEANQHRPIALVGGQVDKSLEGKYGFIQRGLVSQVESVDQTFDLVTIAEDNDTWLRRYRPPDPQSIHRETFEPTVLRSYASLALWVADEYRKVGRASEAAMWYRRALEIDAEYPEARQGLSRVTSK